MTHTLNSTWDTQRVISVNNGNKFVKINENLFKPVFVKHEGPW